MLLFSISLLGYHPSPTQYSLTFLSIGIELFKLEQRYTRRKRRTTFISDAQYVNGEYIHTSPISDYTGRESGRERREMAQMSVREFSSKADGIGPVRTRT
jgi:hypothetical protein